MAGVDTLKVDGVAVAVVHCAAAGHGLVNPLGIVGIECDSELTALIAVTSLKRYYLFVDGILVGSIRCAVGEECAALEEGSTRDITGVEEHVVAFVDIPVGTALDGSGPEVHGLRIAVGLVGIEEFVAPV
ncbi:hypothetical protein IMSAG192_00022 [Muribaculaceae bacterium]|nr:hypothetical protein IMSAG192_00022 [Muribaculaceae bacterium]